MPENEKKENERDLDLLDTTMSLGDHLEELRARIILALIGLVIGTILCLLLGTRIIRFIEKPYYNTVRRYEVKRKEQAKETERPAYVADAVFKNILGALATDPNAPKIDPNFVVFVRDVYLETLTSMMDDANYPGVGSTAEDLPAERRLVTLAPADSFIGYMKISILAGLILSSPWVFYQMWMFVAAGLYKHERRYVQTAIPFSVILFVIGALFFLFVVAPISLRFFLGFGDLIGVSASWTFQKYISFVTLLMLVFGIGFQTPIAIYILTRTGLVSIPALKRSRKYVFLCVFIIAAVTTPPDVISQITLAFPLYALFELGILISYVSQRRRERAEQRQDNEHQD